MDSIQIRGARVHNLKNVSLDIPHGRLVVITGPSGSGKSSLAFDTLFAESQRQYIESLSLHSRQFLDQLERPDVDSIEGLAPAVCIDQRPGRPNPRGTLATATEIDDFLRLLFARLGRAFCPRCQVEIRRQTPEQMKRRLLGLPEGAKLMLLAPLIGAGETADGAAIEQALSRARKAGFVRIRVGEDLIDIDQAPAGLTDVPAPIEAVVDRLVVRPGVETRMAESLQLALRFGEGAVAACWQDGGGQWRREPMTTIFACPSCRTRYEELTPRTFSFNSPYGACPTCTGLGTVAPWFPGSAWEPAVLKAPPSLPDDAKKKRQSLKDSPFPGGAWERDVCLACLGARLNEQARHVQVGGRAMHEIGAWPLRETLEFFGKLSFDDHEMPIARPLLAEIVRRLEFLDAVGLAYLSLDRATDSLSGGERQRARLASGMGGALVGACYILDEPSVGLHPRDNDRLIAALMRLRDLGNTLVVVEHDEAIVRVADWLIDMGPGAGREGGRVLEEGTPDRLARTGQSLTCRYLRGELSPPIRPRRPVEAARLLRLEGARAHNLKNVDVEIPLGCFVCITGVSGSGKSSLVLDTLAPAVARRLGRSAPAPGPFTRLTGVELLQSILQVEPVAPAYSARSNPATYVGVFDEIRKLFAATREARQRGFRASRFSPSDKQGRCPECNGYGEKRLEMNFLPDLTIVCPLCRGARFNRQTLLVRLRDKSLADVLAMTVNEAIGFFDSFVKIAEPLSRMRDVGLGYLPLGQPADTLSGGEWQRLRLARELAVEAAGPTLYVFDEPTSGLHAADVQRLLAVLHELVDRGNTVVAIEHHLDVAKSADWIIDMGPDGGEHGGRIVAAGTPEEIAACESSHTGCALGTASGLKRETAK